MITSAQIRAARHLVSLSQADIANATSLSLPTIKRAESEREVAVSEDALASIRAALETAGVEFIDGDQLGVRLRKIRKRAAEIREDWDRRTAVVLTGERKRQETLTTKSAELKALRVARDKKTAQGVSDARAMAHRAIDKHTEHSEQTTRTKDAHKRSLTEMPKGFGGAKQPK